MIPSVVRPPLTAGPVLGSAEYPLLPGRVVSVVDARCVIIKADCPICGEVHRHTWNRSDGPSVATDRVPHCPQGTPGRPRRYYVTVEKGVQSPGVPVIRKKRRAAQ